MSLIIEGRIHRITLLPLPQDPASDVDQESLIHEAKKIRPLLESLQPLEQLGISQLNLSDFEHKLQSNSNSTDVRSTSGKKLFLVEVQSRMAIILLAR